MLVLTRRLNERIVIPDLDLFIKVLSVKGNTVRLGITAPAHVKVMRGELLLPCVGVAAVVPPVL